MYKWMNYIVSPEANAEVAQYFGEAPAQSKACTPSTLSSAAKAIDYPVDTKFCDEYHAADPTFWKQVYYWQSPVRRLRKRQRRLQGLQRLGERVDGDQGMIAAAAAS